MMKLSQEQLLEKAIQEDPVYCITRYINRCAWEEEICISEPMVRATTFFAFVEYLRIHNVKLFSEPFGKGAFGPLVAKQFAYTGAWGPHRWLNPPTESDMLVICDEAAKDFQILNYNMVKRHFDAELPHLRSIVVRIFKALDNMTDIEITELLMKISNRTGAIGNVSIQELRNFQLFEDFANKVPVTVEIDEDIAMEMISAHEARKLAKPNFEAHIAFINESITEAATKGKTEVIIRKAPYRNWLYDREQTREAKAVLGLLKAKGFQCKLYYNEAQFVDIGLHIIWE